MTLLMRECHDRWRELYEVRKTLLKTIPLIECTPRALNWEPMALFEISLRLPDGRLFSQVCDSRDELAATESLCEMAQRATRQSPEVHLRKWVLSTYTKPAKRNFAPPLSHGTQVYVHPKFANLLKWRHLKTHADVTFMQYIGAIVPKTINEHMAYRNYTCAFVGSLTVTESTDLMLMAIQQKINSIEKANASALFGEPPRRQLLLLLTPEPIKCRYESDWCRLETVSCMRVMSLLLQSSHQNVDVVTQ
jgi:hypothetical protein